MKSAVVIPMVLVGGMVLGFLLDHLAFARRLALALVVLSMAYIIDVNLAFVPAYRGMTRGFDLGTSDVLLVGVGLFTLVHARRFGWSSIARGRPVPRVTPVVLVPPGFAPLVLFIGVAALSVLGARIPLFGWMDLSKLIRGLALFWIAANLLRDDEIVDRIPSFLLLYVGIEVVVCTSQYLRGFWWIPGTFSHKNSFALATNMVLPTIFAMALLGRPRHMGIYALFYAGGAVCLILSRSRMGWFTMALAGASITTASIALALRWRERAQVKAQLLVLGAFVLLALPALLIMADGIVSRFGEDREASMDFRHRNNFIATKLADDNLFGVGLNNYVVELREPIGAILPELDRTVAHHLYRLVAAETGYIGLATFIAALAALWGIGLYTLAAARRRTSRIITLGLLVGLSTAYLHSFLESDLLRRETYFIFCILAGLLSGVHLREGLRGWVGLMAVVLRFVRHATEPHWDEPTPAVQRRAPPPRVILHAEPLLEESLAPNDELPPPPRALKGNRPEES